MPSDIRGSEWFKRAREAFSSCYNEETGAIFDIADLNASPDCEAILFTGTIMPGHDQPPVTRVYRLDAWSQTLARLSDGPNSDQKPAFSSDGKWIAFLSDRRRRGDFQLYLMDALTTEIDAAPDVHGWVERLEWCPDGKSILLLVAAYGSDLAGGQGSSAGIGDANNLPGWLPEARGNDSDEKGRRLFVFDLDTRALREVGNTQLNIWQACWCGLSSIAVAASVGGDENAWYQAFLGIFDLRTGHFSELYRPEHQLALLAASPSGKSVAIIEGLCSDRGIVSGQLKAVDVSSKDITELSAGFDVSYAAWQSESDLILAGHDGFKTMVGHYCCSRFAFSCSWASEKLSTSGYYASVAPLAEIGDCLMVSEGFIDPPSIVRLRGCRLETLRSFGHRSELYEEVRDIQRVEWVAKDKTKLQGWLLLPQGIGPFSTVMCIHGGPIWHWHPVWLPRGNMSLLLLVKQGVAVFLPNPRGSTGRGPQFAEAVLGDMGGADSQDLLSGLDHLEGLGLSESRHLGVMGKSYGGYMTAWLVTQEKRFSAAVAIAPFVNFVSQRLVSNIPQFMVLFAPQDYFSELASYHRRSPIMFAHQVETPVLCISGAQDRCTPPEEALQFYAALRANNQASALITYPFEGHGVKGWPAMVDYTARILQWLISHLAGP